MLRVSPSIPMECRHVTFLYCSWLWVVLHASQVLLVPCSFCLVLVSHLVFYSGETFIFQVLLVLNWSSILGCKLGFFSRQELLYANVFTQSILNLVSYFDLSSMAGSTRSLYPAGVALRVIVEHKLTHCNDNWWNLNISLNLWPFYVKTKSIVWI